MAKPARPVLPKTSRPSPRPIIIIKRTTPLAERVFFYPSSGQYFMPLSDGRFIPMSASDIKNQFKLSDFHADMKNDCGLSAGDELLSRCQTQRFVDYAGPLAGHKAGMFEMASGLRVLVTTSSRPVVARRGDCDGIESFVGELLGAQARHWLLWAKVGWESCHKGDMRPGQCAVFAGASECGKSFLQVLITCLLGGRSANPFLWMNGETSFNADLAMSEHLCIEDPSTSFDIRSRRKFGAAIKNLTVVKEMSVHGKGKQALNLPTFKRITISVNDEPENLMVLPPLDNSMLDKFNLYLCSRAKISADREKNMAMLYRELPAFAWSLSQMKIPSSLHSPRYGVTAFHNEKLMEVLCDISDETRLLNIIDEIIFAAEKDSPIWTGSASQLQAELLAEARYSYTVAKILPHSSSCGTYLARLAGKLPERFKSTRSAGKTKWTIIKEKDENHE